MHLRLLLFLALCQICVGQEIPVEIELVPPTGMTYIELSAPQPEIIQSVKKPKTRPCRVCKEVVVPGHCRCYELLTNTTAKRLYQEVRELLASASEGQIKLKKAVGVRVVSRTKLAQMGGERLLGLYQDGSIYLSDDLNRRQALGVLAHEYGHAWFFQHRADVSAASDLLFEGFPEFVSYLVLREAGDHEGAYRISTVDRSVYGRGARKFIALYNRVGIELVVNTALRRSSI